MARQFALGGGNIIPTALHSEMERSYLEYAMSVIVGRALPDARDGLKPVHRRILYAMHELGLSPERPFRKCARVVGDVLGKYHPHGDQSVYDALVRMVQDFSSRYPLVGGHGNFGSIDNDPPAAMRYTETRLATITHEAVLANISEAIVDFTDNFDNSHQEPTVLPAQLPLLLLEGCSGIAVGMATNVPPHNLGEIVDGLIALIDNPQLSDEKLWRIIPGPDFPTGGEIINTSGIVDAYLTGRGTIPVRGVTHLERLSYQKGKKRKRTAIIVTELPFQVNKAGWIGKIADLVNQGKLEGIADIRDESDRRGMRVVIELKRDSNPEKILAALYQKTSLQSNFGAILLALVDNKPCQLSLRGLLQVFLDFREETLICQYRHDLGVAEQRQHVVTGLLSALTNLDAVIEILRHAADGTMAKLRFQEELSLSPTQADAILAMPMRRLTGLERQKLQTEAEELSQNISQLNQLLNERPERLKELKKGLRALKRKFGDKRRTKIRQTAGGQQSGKRSIERNNAPVYQAKQERKKSSNGNSLSISSAVLTPVESIASQQSQLQLFTPQPPPEGSIIEVTNQGSIFWENPQEVSDTNHGETAIIFQGIVRPQEQLILFTEHGKAYPLPLNTVPPAGDRLVNILELLPQSASSSECANINQFFSSQLTDDLILLTQQGRIKRLSVAELALPLNRRGISLIKLKEGDRLSFICSAKPGKDLVIATSGGRLLRIPLSEQALPQMGRMAQGEKALRLRYGESLVGCLSLHPEQCLLLATELGYLKKLTVHCLRLAKLGDIGNQALQFTQKEDRLVAIAPVTSECNVLVVTHQGRTIPISIDGLNLWGKDGIGDSLNTNQLLIGHQWQAEERILSLITTANESQRSNPSVKRN